jgi:dolichol-phosphate mannosyltransferase
LQPLSDNSIVLSIVVPVFKEEDGLPAFLQRLLPVVEPLSPCYEVIFCLDPSPDRTEEIILEYRQKNPRIKYLKFSRRVGQPMATLAGLHYSRGDAVLIIDADLQDPPELLTEMFAKWREGYDVIMARRRTRAGETWMKIVVSWLAYKVINQIAEVPIPRDTGDFRLMSRRAVNAVNNLKESHGFLRGMVALVGFRQAFVEFDRPPRFAGKGNYNQFLGSIRIGMNGLLCFSSYLLTLSTRLGFVITLISFLLALVLVVKLIACGPSHLSTLLLAALIFFMGGVQLLSIGVLGEYITRIYDEVRDRPKFIVDRAEGIDIAA